MAEATTSSGPRFPASRGAKGPSSAKHSGGMPVIIPATKPFICRSPITRSSRDPKEVTAGRRFSEARMMARISSAPEPLDRVARFFGKSGMVSTDYLLQNPDPIPVAWTTATGRPKSWTARAE